MAQINYDPDRNYNYKKKNPLDDILDPIYPSTPFGTRTITSEDDAHIVPIDPNIIDPNPPVIPDDVVPDDVVPDDVVPDDVVPDDVVPDDVIDDVLEDESPWVNPFMKVYETTKEGAMTNLEEQQMLLAKKFAHHGGYFGGEHAVSQSKLAAETGQFLDKLLAEVSLGATEAEYKEWVRARGEFMSLVNILPVLLGTESFQNLIGQEDMSWLNSIFQAIGLAIGSSKEFKKDISEISEEDEQAIFEKLTSTPLFKYRYKFETDEATPHLGVITEHSPSELTLFDNKMVGLAEYISSLHAAMKVMSKKIKRLENGG